MPRSRRACIPDNLGVLARNCSSGGDARSSHGRNRCRSQFRRHQSPALIAADFVVVPLAPDLFSMQGLRNLGPRLRDWRVGWGTTAGQSVPNDLPLPSGDMRPIGYIVMQHAVRLDRPTVAYQRWVDRSRRSTGSVLDQQAERPSVSNDPFCLALLKHYRSLIPLAQEARKPIFKLKPADGAIGAHFQAAQDSYGHFQALARRIAKNAGVELECVQ